MKKFARLCKSPLAAGLMGVVTGSLLLASGPAVGDPQSKPTITLAPYVLKSTDLRRGATNAYRPWFENGAWTGDLIEYHISEQGERCTSVAVGEFPADDSGNSANCDHNNWSARGVFPDKIDSGDGTLVDEPAAATYWKVDRNVFTYGEGEVNNRIPFWWDELSTAQKNALDPVTCGLEEGACAAEGVDQDDPEASIVLNFLRGDRSAELDKPGGIFRLRYSLLGAVINSRPAYLNVNDGLVVVGANDGIVHGFDASNGQELFGYVPSIFMSSLETLTRSPFSFRYFADGELRGRNIREELGDDSYARRDIVTGGFGAGGKGLFALDVTNPNDPTILFELSGSEADYIAGEYLPSLGHIYGRPTIARLPDDQWYIVAGNGHGSGAGARLLLIRLTGNAPGVDYVVSEIIADPSADNGLSAPALVSSTDDFSRVDIAYAGDEFGNLYRFNLSNTAAPTSTKIFSAGANKPITIEPDIARHPTQLGVMVYFGTGRLFEQADASITTTQSIYGIWDETFTGSEVFESELFQKELVQETGTWDGTERTVRIIIGSADPNDPTKEQQPVWEGDNKHRGWRVDLPIAGERLLGRPQVRANRLQFISTNPVSDPQSTAPGDGSWFNQLSLASGGSLNPPVPLYDLDRSGVLDDGDAIEVEVEINGEMVPTSFFPLSLNLGPGNIAQPAFASVEQDIDAIFINALLLPPPPEPEFSDMDFGGDIDVTTDSPTGPLVNPHDASHPEYWRYGEDYPDPSHPASPPARGPMNIHLGQDGRGNRVDGHHRAYEKVHGVKYVDYFNLEPRRGKVRLDPGPLDSEGNPFIAIQELNGPTDNLFGDPMLDEENQKFIVVLANADLSQGTEIQIGCRTWKTFDYQEMITPQLKAGTPPSALVDENGESLVFTLNSIRADTGCDEPTLRITVTGRVGSEGVLHGTLPGCVNNTHNYEGEPKTGGHPHITKNQEQQSSGYRWRNGALTMQLLAVNPDNTAAYVLQASDLPESRRTIGNGGIFAQGFTVTGTTVTPVDGPNGLLYESSVFWNFGDMWEFQQAGQGIKCYGAPAYNAALVNEIFGLNSGQYDGLVSNLRIDDDLLSSYEAALAALANAQTEAELTAALLNLAALFDGVAGSWGRHDVLTLADHYRLRGYAHQAQFNLDLLDIDRQLFEPPPPVELGIDGTPANVEDIELDLLPAAGPNYQPGRRSWVDLTPE
jgi:hypothetical protein